MTGTQWEGLHRLRMHAWLLYGIYAMLAFLGIGGLTYGLLVPAVIDEATWAAAPGLSLPYRVACDNGADGKQRDEHLILVSGHQQAQRLLASLCIEAGALDVGIAAYWGLSDDDRRRLLKAGRTAVVFGRDHLVASEAVASLQAYQEIAVYPPYASQLIAPTPIEATRLGLSGKRIGLLRDASSRSGRLVPAAYFRAIGLQATDYRSVLADSHRELRDLLAAGEVDVIASYWGEVDARWYPDWVATQINAGVEGARWYLRPDLLGTPFSCVFQRTLVASATDNGNPYFQQLKVTARDCL